MTIVMVQKMEELQKRKPNRLKEYDYSQNGYYFITICVKDRQELLWDPTGDDVGAATCRPHVELSDLGKLVDAAIHRIPMVYDDVQVRKYVIMPNHVHMIINTEKHGRQVAAPTISVIVGNMKRNVSIQIGFSPWQRSFHDHVFRNEAEYIKIWSYIDSNPLTWGEDKYFCSGEQV